MDHTLSVFSIFSTIFSQLFFSSPAGNFKLKVTTCIFFFSRHLMFSRYASKAWFFPIRSIFDLFSSRFSPDTWGDFLTRHSTSHKSVLFLRKRVVSSAYCRILIDSVEFGQTVQQRSVFNICSASIEDHPDTGHKVFAQVK